MSMLSNCHNNLVFICLFNIELKLPVMHTQSLMFFYRLCFLPEVSYNSNILFSLKSMIFQAATWQPYLQKFQCFAASSMVALKQPTISVVAIIAEGVPESDTKQLISYARANNKVGA
jgi:hypothetical protein